MLKPLLSLNVFLQLVLFIAAIFKLKNPKYQRRTLPLAHFFGAYVWEDVLILSFFWLIVSVVLVYLNSVQLLLFIILIFIAIRSFFETIYWLLQQFNSTDYRPFDFGFHRLNNHSIYIIYQVLNLSVLALSLFTLIIVFTEI